MRREIAADAPGAVADRDRVFSALRESRRLGQALRRRPPFGFLRHWAVPSERHHVHNHHTGSYTTIYVLPRNAAFKLREDFLTNLTKWKAVFTPAGAATNCQCGPGRRSLVCTLALAGTVCSSGTARRRSLQCAHLKKAELELEKAVKIYNFTSRREMCTVDSRESDSWKHCELATGPDRLQGRQLRAALKAAGSFHGLSD
jgi:hypothetical protein